MRVEVEDRRRIVLFPAQPLFVQICANGSGKASRQHDLVDVCVCRCFLRLEVVVIGRSLLR